MKKVMYLLFVLTFFSCTQVTKTNHFTLIGNLNEKKAGEKLLLINSHNDQVVDSTFISSTGSFQFVGSYEDNIIVDIKLNNKKVAFCILEKDTIILDSMSQMPGNTPMNDALASSLQDFRSYETSVRSKFQAIQKSDLSIAIKKSKSDSILDTYLSHMHDMTYTAYMQHEGDAVGTYIFLEMLKFVKAEEFMSILSTATDMTRNYPYIKEMKGFMEAKINTSIGKPYIDFTIENGTLDSTAVSLSDFVGNGKYTLVDFFASWCSSCIYEMDNIRNIYDNYAEQVQCVTLAVWDKQSSTERSVKNINITWPVIYNCQSIPTKIYGVAGIPEILLINPEGIIVARGLSGLKIEKAIRKELGL